VDGDGGPWFECGRVCKGREGKEENGDEMTMMMMRFMILILSLCVLRV
jgi:hypothetical protein